MTPSRRGLLGVAGLLGLSAAGPGAAADNAEAAALQAALERYFGFGVKASGGPGDAASGAWLEGELTRAGYACRRQGFEVPYFEVRQASRVCGEAKAGVIPQASVAPTGPQGLTGPLKLASIPGDLAGAIAVVDLPNKRWVALADPQVSRPLAEAVRRGAAGVVLVTNGPTGEAIALNASTHRPAVERPVALLAPKEAGPLQAAAGARDGPATVGASRADRR